MLIDVQTKLIGLSNDEAKVYDAADGVNNDMKYYSLNVSYTLITCLIDGEMIGGINQKGIVRDGNQIVQVIEGDVFESDFQLPNSVVSLTIPESSIVEKIPKNAISHNSNLKRVSIFSKNSFVIEEEAFSGCSNLETVIINGATVLNRLAFKDCIHLKIVVLDNINEIVGTFNFDG